MVLYGWIIHKETFCIHEGARPALIIFPRVPVGRLLWWGMRWKEKQRERERGRAALVLLLITHTSGGLRGTKKRRVVLYTSFLSFLLLLRGLALVTELCAAATAQHEDIGEDSEGEPFRSGSQPHGYGHSVATTPPPPSLSLSLSRGSSLVKPISRNNTTVSRLFIWWEWVLQGEEVSFRICE